MGDRDGRGRFQPGNRGGPGRPPRQTEREYLNVLVSECSLEDWKAVVQRAVRDAKAGDGKAREWLGRYLAGTPEMPALSLSRMAVEAEAKIDPLASDILLARLDG